MYLAHHELESVNVTITTIIIFIIIIIITITIIIIIIIVITAVWKLSAGNSQRLLPHQPGERVQGV